VSGILLANVGSGKGTSGYTVTAGYQITYPGGVSLELFGYLTGSIGSLSPTTASFSGTTITQIYFSQRAGFVQSLVLTVTGTVPQAAFTAMTIGSTSFTSSSATYSTGATTTWTWVPSSNLFPTAGSNYSVTFS